MQCVAVVCLLFAFISAAMAGEMTREETVVRTAYAKLSYAVDLHTVFTSNPVSTDAAELNQQVETHGLRFWLGNFETGNLADALDARYADMFGEYGNGQDVIETSVIAEGYSENGAPVTTEMATAQWATGHGVAPNLTVGQMMPAMEQESGIRPLRRYCTFTVTATLAGRSQTYKAAFFFAEDGRAAPSAAAMVHLGGGALTHFLLHPVYPSIFVRTPLANSSAVRSFIAATQRSESSCKAGTGDVCCDVERLHCGVASADLSVDPRRLQ
jgi:hypothetical protein